MESSTIILFAKLVFGKYTGKCVSLPLATDQSLPKTVCAETTKAPTSALAAVSRGFNAAGAILDLILILKLS
jgi:hypothetical protein